MTTIRLLLKLLFVFLFAEEQKRWWFLVIVHILFVCQTSKRHIAKLTCSTISISMCLSFSAFLDLTFYFCRPMRKFLYIYDDDINWECPVLGPDIMNAPIEFVATVLSLNITEQHSTYPTGCDLLPVFSSGVCVCVLIKYWCLFHSARGLILSLKISHAAHEILYLRIHTSACICSTKNNIQIKWKSNHAKAIVQNTL